MTKESKREKLLSLLGDLPNMPGEVQSRKLKEEDKGTYFLESLLLDLNGEGLVRAYFARPKESSGTMPVVLFNHSHGGNYLMGKTEMISSSEYLQQPSFAEELTRMGYGVFCIDMLGFGERRGKAESELFKELLWKGQVMWGRMVYDNVRAVDYLVNRGDVDGERIAAIGMSMGGLMSWWTAALDERVKVCIDICGQVEAQTLIDVRGLDYHGFYSYVPGLVKHFQTAEIQELIAPRPHLGLVGNHDKLTPYAGLDLIHHSLSAVYAEFGHAEKWRMSRYECGHIETAGMRIEACEFLREYL
jgi:dienelactone hydrolase